MDELIYGVWEGRAYDNRRRLEGEAPEALPLSEFLSFNNGNPAAGFVGPQGFLMFDNRVTLADVLLNYYRRTKELSCGRCTPCRAGSVLICEALEKACAGEGESVDWDRIQLVAEQMAETSLCGVGLSTPAALLGALKYFPELLRQAPVMPVTRRDFFSVATAPCIEACPANVNVPRYIDYIRDGHPELSTGVLLRHYPLVGSCGRVCVRPCETACARNHVDDAVAIKDLKRYAADHVGSTMADLFKKDEIPDTPVSKRVAVIGAGPAGINCAYHLLRKGHHVDVFEAEDYAGGMARLGIPAYRLPNHLLETETEVIERLGGHYHYNCALGRDYTIDSLFRRGYDAIFLGVGCALGQYLNLPNEDQSAHGYLKGLDFLLAIEHHQSRHEDIELDGDIVVVGCGNVAMDCCRTARRLMKGHRRVTVSYRRTRASAPADPEEITAAIDENIHFEFLTAPVEVMVEEGRVIGLKLIRMQEGEPDASGRRSVKPIAGSEFIVPCRYVIAAIGQKLDDSVFSEADGIKLTKRGTIEVDESLQTSREGVFAGGDAAAGPTSLIWGMAQGQDAANAIHEYLMTHTPGFNARRRMSRLIKEANLLGTCAPERAVVLQPRQVMSHLAPQARVQNWDEVEHGFTDQEAWAEAKRCMRCYRLFGVSTLKPIPGKTASEDL